MIFFPNFPPPKILHPCSVSSVTNLGKKSFKFELLEVAVDRLVEAPRAHQCHLLSDSGGDLVRVRLLHQSRLEEQMLVVLLVGILLHSSWYGGSVGAMVRWN